MIRQSRAIWIAIAFASLLLLWFVLHFALRGPAIGEPCTVAHRGGAGLAPENTLAAVEAALSRGNRFIEVDVRRTADDVLVLLHNSSVDTLEGGSCPIGELNWAEASVLDVGSRFDSSFAGETIPTLDEVLEAIAGTGTTLFLEVKDPRNYPGIGLQVLEALARYELTDNVVVLSFDEEWLYEFHDVGPTVPLGLLCVWKGNMPQSNTIIILDVFWGAIVADPTLVKRAHDSGLEVVAWTVNSPFLMELMLQLGVDGITTDYPDRCAQVLASRASSSSHIAITGRLCPVLWMRLPSNSWGPSSQLRSRSICGLSGTNPQAAKAGLHP